MASAIPRHHVLWDQPLPARAEGALQAAQVLLHRGVVGACEAPLVAAGKEHHQERLEGGPHHLPRRHRLRPVRQHQHLVQRVPRVQEDEPGRGDLGHDGDGRRRRGARAVEAGGGGGRRERGVEGRDGGATVPGP